jgi:putative transposase
MSSERLAAAVTASVNSISDSFDTLLTETINGLYETELINPGNPWRTVDEAELATAEWVN